MLWRIAPFAILWSIWKERNDKIFREAATATANLTSMVFSGIAKWASARKEYANLTSNDILFNWEVCLACCPNKRKRGLALVSLV